MEPLMPHTDRKIIAFRSGETPAPFCQSEAVRAGPFIFTSAKLATDWKSGIVPEAHINPEQPYLGDSAELQTDYIMRSLVRTLHQAGSTLEHVVKAHVFLREGSAFGGFDRVWKRYFTAPPTRTTVGADGLLVPDARLEISLIALAADTGLKHTAASSDGPRPLTKKVEAMRGGDFVFTSGQLAHDAVSGVAEEAKGPGGAVDFAKQTTYTLNNLLRSLKAAGANADQVIKCQALLLDASDEKSYMGAWGGKFSNRTALSVLGCGSLLVGGTALEIDLTAYVGSDLRLPAAIGPRGPEAIGCGDLVFSAGVFPGFDTGELPEECKVHPAYPHYSSPIRLQTEWVLKRLDRALRCVGSDLAHVAKAQVFLTDLNDFAQFDDVWRQYFPTPPARSVVGSSGLAVKDARIAVEVYALTK
jgi:enamine deaminase RidA (YjgF/YER057c/UK114 family)